MKSSRFDTVKPDRAGPRSVALPRNGGNYRRRSVKTYAFSHEPGTRLGADLVVTGHVSAGPYTEIYRVWSEARHCSFVCKVLRRELDPGDAHRAAFAHERGILGRLSHPNVVRVFGTAHGMNAPHVLMEDLGGPSLLELLGSSPRRRLKPHVALRIAVGIASALAAVHAIGYLYRDLKPANVLMRDGSPVLVDFGAAYRWAPGRKPRARIGTDPYMAPEQCLGHALSPPTDVFGLGAVTYEMLTGEWPFEDQLMNVFDRTRLRNRFPQIAFAPGSIRRRVAGIDPAIERVVDRCLERDPAERYADAASALAELNHALGRDDRVYPEVGSAGQAA